jgi:transcriptional regulator with GAF, ATPase, and Fis domain
MTGTAEWPDFAVRLAEMARDLLAQPSVQDTLDRIAYHAVQLVDGCEAAGIMAVRRGQVHTLSASDNVVRASDRLQGELGEGPCFDASRNKTEAYRIADFTTREKQWPRFVPEARKLGVGSMMGFLLYTRERDDLGALDMYSSRPSAFTERSEQVGWLLASHAAVVLSGARHVENLQEGMESRRVIGEAIGIVMTRYKVPEQDAFARIVAASQSQNIKVRDLAETISHIGDIPEPTQPSRG